MEDSMVNLGELVRRAQDGDIGGYEHIVKRFQPSAFSHAFSVLGDIHLAEDAVQDAFVAAYRNLDSLRVPEAFASWFHKLVSTACSRMTRRRTVSTTALEEAESIADTSESPANRLERKQREQAVHIAIQELPDSLRTVTALYYIGGIGQRDIADYLGLTETVVKKRLFDARKKLKEDIMNMARKISDEGMPPDQVSARVIAELVSRPQLLLIKDHPIRQVLDQIKIVLSDYEVIDSREVEEIEIYPSIRKAYYAEIGDTYQLDANHILRSQTTGATFRAIQGRQPPIRLLTAGRVFRTKEDEQHLRVFHEVDGICVTPDASLDELRETLTRLLSAVLGQTEIRWRDCNEYGFIDHGMDADAYVNSMWEPAIGCGMLKSEMLREAGHDSKQVQGYAFGLSLERLALFKFGLKNIHELWRPPYLR